MMAGGQKTSVRLLISLRTAVMKICFSFFIMFLYQPFGESSLNRKITFFNTWSHIDQNIFNFDNMIIADVLDLYNLYLSRSLLVEDSKQLLGTKNHGH